MCSPVKPFILLLSGVAWLMGGAAAFAGSNGLGLPNIEQNFRQQNAASAARVQDSARQAHKARQLQLHQRRERESRLAAERRARRRQLAQDGLLAPAGK